MSKSMKCISLIAALSFLSLLSVAQGVNSIWEKSFGRDDDLKFVSSHAVVSDKVGNVYSTGAYRGTNGDFDPGPGVANIQSNGGMDAFIHKLSPNGNFLWVRSLGGTKDDRGYDIAVDESGNVYVTGNFRGAVDLDPGPAIDIHTTTSDNTDAFVMKLDPAGHLVWVHSFGAAGNDSGRSIAIDQSGNLLVTGYFDQTVDFDPGVGETNLTSSYGAFVQKLTPQGDLLWAHSYDGPSELYVNAITSDENNNIYLTGRFNGNVDFDPSPNSAFTLIGLFDVFVSKLDSMGNLKWAGAMGGGSKDAGLDVAVDTSGAVLVVGSFQGGDLCPGDSVVNYASQGLRDLFVTRLDSMGHFLWAHGIGGLGSDEATGVSVDKNGNSYITGSFQKVVDFNPESEITEFSTISISMFIQKFTPSGQMIWARKLGEGGSSGSGIWIDDSYIYGTGMNDLNGYVVKLQEISASEPPVIEVAPMSYGTNGIVSLSESPSDTVSLEGYKLIGIENGQLKADGQPVAVGDIIIENTQVSFVPTGAGMSSITMTKVSKSQQESQASVAEFEVAKASLTVSFSDVSKKYGEDMPDFTLTYSGFVNGDSEAGLDVAPSAFTTATQASDAGSYDVTVSGGQSDNYTFTYVSGKLEILKAPLTVTAQDQFKTYSENNPPFTITYSGFVNADSEADLDVAPSASTTATQASDAGTYDIVASGGTSTNYELTYKKGTFTVNQATASVTITDLKQAFDGSPKMPTVATSPNGLTYEVTYNGLSDPPSAVGEYNIEASISEKNYSGSNTGVLVIYHVLAAVEEVQQSHEWLIYPNPTKNSFKVRLPNSITTARVKVIDAQGRKILDLQAENNVSYKINPNPGIYWVKLENADTKDSSVKKLIIR